MSFYARLKFNIQESKVVFEEIFNGATPVFVASFVPELFTCLLGHSQSEQTNDRTWLNHRLWKLTFVRL